MRIHRRTVLLTIAVLAAAPWRADAQDARAAAPIRALEQALAGSGGAAPGRAAVRSAVARSFNVDLIARSVLAGQTFTAGQLARFREALTDQLASEMLQRIGRERRRPVAILRTRLIRPAEWLVDTRLAVARGQEVVSWRVAGGTGGALIIDVLSNGTSLVRAWRNEYLPMLRRIGLDAMIQRIEARSRRAAS